jgi:hypothetical protein
MHRSFCGNWTRGAIGLLAIRMFMVIQRARFSTGEGSMARSVRNVGFGEVNSLGLKFILALKAECLYG